MADDRPGVLVPIEILDGESVPEPLVALLAELPVVLLGYHVLPEQTAPGQARLQFEERAQAALDAVAETFEAAGVAVETRLVFTNDEERTVDRVAEETGCAAVLLPNPTGPIGRVLVAVGADTDTDRIGAFVLALVGDRPLTVTVHGADDAVAAAVEALQAGGLPADALERHSPADGSVETLVAAAENHDVVVLEEDTSLRGLLVGGRPEHVAAHSLGPVLVVRR